MVGSRRTFVILAFAVLGAMLAVWLYRSLQSRKMTLFDQCIKHEDGHELMVFQCGPEIAAAAPRPPLRACETPWPHRVRSLELWQKLVGHDTAVVFLGRRGDGDKERLVGVEVQLPDFGVQYPGVRFIELHGYSIRPTSGTARGAPSTGYLKLFVADDEPVCIFAGEKRQGALDRFSFVVSVGGVNLRVDGFLDGDIVRMVVPEGEVVGRECIVWSKRARARH